MNVQIEGMFQEAIPIENYGINWLCRQGGTYQSLSVKISLCISSCLCVAQETFIYQTLAFLSPCQSPFSPFKSQTASPNVLFCLQRKMEFKVRVLAIQLLSFPGLLSCEHVTELLNDFILLICLMAIYFLERPEEPRGSSSLPSKVI